MESSRISQGYQKEPGAHQDLDDGQRIRVVLAEVHDLVRTGMQALLSGISDIKIVGEASDGDGALRQINELRPDIAIIDISMPGLNGTEVTRLVRAHYPGVKVLIMTTHEDAEVVGEIVHSGASGYILKDADSVEIVRAIRAVATNPRFFSPTVPPPKIDALIRKATERNRSADAGDLTEREQEILVHISDGMTNREIAQKLSLSLNTVNTHRMNIMKKLNIHNTVGLVKYALRLGLTDLHS